MHASALASTWFLIATSPICIFVAYSDMARMKIPNQAVIAMVAVFSVMGLFFMPLSEFGWRWVHLVVVLVVGFVMNMVKLLGAGDAKFAAAMALFVNLGDLITLLTIFTAVMIVAFACHRIARAIPAVRNLAPNWESWTRKDFPMGLALGPALLAYLALAAKYGSASL